MDLPGGTRRVPRASGGVDEVADLAHGDRERREVRGGSGLGVGEDLQPSRDRARVPLEPERERIRAWAVTEDLRSERTVFAVEIFPQRPPGERFPALSRGSAAIRACRECSSSRSSIAK